MNAVRYLVWLSCCATSTRSPGDVLDCERFVWWKAEMVAKMGDLPSNSTKQWKMSSPIWLAKWCKIHKVYIHFTFNAIFIIHQDIYSHSTTMFLFKKYIYSHLTTYFLFTKIFTHILRDVFIHIQRFIFVHIHHRILVQRSAIFIQHFLHTPFAHR